MKTRFLLLIAVGSLPVVAAAGADWPQWRGPNRDDVSKEMVARKIIALAKAGERDPERLCESVLKEFRVPPPRPSGQRPDEISARDGRP